MLVKVKVFPASKKREVVRDGDRFKVRVKEKAENREANKAAVKALASFLGISEKKIRIAKGSKKQNKIFEIHD
jgi:uncharacterized protein YggU (UPF0235/DUF167 family)